MIDKPLLINSRLLPVTHGFSTRIGGVSREPFSTLNLAHSVGDETASVVENEQRLAREVGAEVCQFAHVHQVHGDRIVEVTPDLWGERPRSVVIDTRFLGEADGLITRERGVVLSIRTADCVPVLFYAPGVEAIAAVHAGWRGTELAIAKRAVEELSSRYGADRSKILVAIGPSIRRCCFAVSDDVAVRFRARFGDKVVFGGAEGQPHVDLAEANCLSLIEAGLRRNQIDVLPHCTHCDSHRFFSHRRDKGRTGRHVSFIALKSMGLDL